MATKRMEDSWRRVKQHIVATWGDDFSDSELKSARGDLRQMVALIHDKTGDPRKEIVQRLSTVI